jgi:hypothetical protein
MERLRARHRDQRLVIDFTRIATGRRDDPNLRGQPCAHPAPHIKRTDYSGRRRDEFTNRLNAEHEIVAAVAVLPIAPLFTWRAMMMLPLILAIVGDPGLSRLETNPPIAALVQVTSIPRIALLADPPVAMKLLFLMARFLVSSFVAAPRMVRSGLISFFHNRFNNIASRSQAAARCRVYLPG